MNADEAAKYAIRKVLGWALVAGAIAWVIWMIIQGQIC